jgi:hypothetical protein
MKRFVQKDFWQLNFAEPVPDLAISKRTSMRQRLMDRLHRVFNKEPNNIPVVSLSYSGAFCTITTTSDSIYVKSAEGNTLSYIDQGTTLSDLVDKLNTLSIFTANLVSAEYAEWLAIGLFEDTIQVGSEPIHLQYPQSHLWQENKTVGISLEEQSARISAAADQMYFHSSDSSWLDTWAKAYFGIERYSGETDTDYRTRAIKEIMRPTQNNVALENIIFDTLGIAAKILDAIPYASELPPPYTLADANNRFLLDMAISSELTETEAQELVERVKAVVRRHKAAGTDFLEVPLRKYHNPSESLSVKESYKLDIDIAGITETLQNGPIKVGAGWRVGTPGLKVGTNSWIKEQTFVRVIKISDGTVTAQYLIGG